VTDRPSEGRATDKDQIKPFHAKEVATGQEAADVVAAVLKHAAARDEAAKKKTPPKPQPIWMLPMGLTLAVLATFLLVAPPPWVVVNPIAAQAPENAVENLQSAFFFYGGKIEHYRIDNGRLPQTLAEAGVDVSGLGYSVSGDSYMLISSVGDRDVVFNSANGSLRDWAVRELPGLREKMGS
jgi:hypothetical protein